MLTPLCTAAFVGFSRFWSSDRQVRTGFEAESRGPPVFVSECACMCACCWEIIGAVVVSQCDFGVEFHASCALASFYFINLLVFARGSNCVFFVCFFLVPFVISRVSLDGDYFLTIALFISILLLKKNPPWSGLLYFYSTFFSTFGLLSLVLFCGTEKIIDF